MDCLNKLLDNYIQNSPHEYEIEEHKSCDTLTHDVQKDPWVKMDIREIVEGEGLVFEKHSVLTQDKYILTIHRVYSPHYPPGVNKPIVFV